MIRKDRLTPAQRSYCMSRVRGRDTDLERALRGALHKAGVRFRKHVAKLPGRPDAVFQKEKVAVFIDGDFWHGYRYPCWRRGLSPFWRTKIETNRNRDRRNFRRLHNSGWTVVRIWQHQIEADLELCTARVLRALDA